MAALNRKDGRAARPTWLATDDAGEFRALSRREWLDRHQCGYIDKRTGKWRDGCCAVPGCHVRQHARGLCRKHYDAARSGGSGISAPSERPLTAYLAEESCGA
jgi:hypothetical protein